MQEDPLIHDKIINLLGMDSNQRCRVLKNWLEQLRFRKAPENLLNALGCLLDDTIAKQILAFVKEHNPL